MLTFPFVYCCGFVIQCVKNSKGSFEKWDILMELYTLRPVSGSLTDTDIPDVLCVNVLGI